MLGIIGNRFIQPDEGNPTLMDDPIILDLFPIFIRTEPRMEHENEEKKKS